MRSQEDLGVDLVNFEIEDGPSDGSPRTPSEATAHPLAASRVEQLRSLFAPAQPSSIAASQGLLGRPPKMTTANSWSPKSGPLKDDVADNIAARVHEQLEGTLARLEGLLAEVVDAMERDAMHIGSRLDGIAARLPPISGLAASSTQEDAAVVAAPSRESSRERPTKVWHGLSHLAPIVHIGTDEEQKEEGQLPVVGQGTSSERDSFLRPSQQRLRFLESDAMEDAPSALSVGMGSNATSAPARSLTTYHVNHRGGGGSIMGSVAVKSFPLGPAMRPFLAPDSADTFGARATERRQTADVERESSPDSWLARVVMSQGFAALSVAVICINVIVTTLRVDYKARNLIPETSPEMLALETAFTFYYVCEVSLKIYAYRCKFFTGPTRYWNIFDFVLVTAACAELITTGSQDVVGIRSLRFLSVIGTARRFKVSWFLQDLRTMAVVAIKSLTTMVWVLLFLTTAMGVSSIVFVEVMTYHRGEGSNPLLTKWFGSVPSALLLMTMSNFGGIDWHEVYEVITAAVPWTGPAFVLLLLFLQLSLLNIVTSIFVDKAMQLGTPAEDELIQKRLREDLRDRELLREFVNGFEVDRSGNVSFDELRRQFEKPDIRTFFQLHGLNIRDVKVFFQTLAAFYTTDSIGVEAFVDGCMKAKGSASSLDMQAVRLQGQVVTEMLARVIAFLQVPMASARSDARDVGSESSLVSMAVKKTIRQPRRNVDRSP